MTRPLLKLTYKDPPEWTNSVAEAVNRFVQGERNFVVRAPVPEWDGVDPDTYTDTATKECLLFLRKHIKQEIRKAADRVYMTEREKNKIRVEFTVGRDIAITADPESFVRCSWNQYTIHRFRLSLLHLDVGDKLTLYGASCKEPYLGTAKTMLLKHPQYKFVCETDFDEYGEPRSATLVRIPFEQSAYRAPKELRRSELVMPSF